MSDPSARARVRTANALVPVEAPGYPQHPEALPSFDLNDGRYRSRFVTDVADLERVLRLRYEVFNIELGEGLESSERTGLDLDPFDAQCHHLIVETSSGEVVGTYRMQLGTMAAAGGGFYTSGEYRLEDWPPDLLANAIEVGRACVARTHRRSNVLLNLWKGLLAYVLHNRKRYLFGCCSITSQDPAEAARALAYLAHEDHMHPTLCVQPTPAYACGEETRSSDGWETVRIPPLFRTYLRHGAKICGRPALDREFKTIDFLALIDVATVNPTLVLKQLETEVGSIDRALEPES